MNKESLSLDDDISVSPGVVSTFAKELTVTTCVMQCSSYKMSTSLSDSAKCKQMKLNTDALIPELTLIRRLDLKVCLQPDVKLG